MARGSRDLISESLEATTGLEPVYAVLQTAPGGPEGSAHGLADSGTSPDDTRLLQARRVSKGSNRA